MSLFRTRLTSAEIRAADSTKHLVTDIPADPQESLDEAKRRVRAAGWTFYPRLDTFHGRKYTMTLRRRIGLSVKFNSYPTILQAAIIWHELYHVEQRLERGHSRFVWDYRNAFGRFVIEMPAHRQELLAMEKMTGGHLHGTNWTKKAVPRIRASYLLGRIDLKQYNAEATAILHKARMLPTD